MEFGRVADCSANLILLHALFNYNQFYCIVFRPVSREIMVSSALVG